MCNPPPLPAVTMGSMLQCGGGNANYGARSNENEIVSHSSNIFRCDVPVLQVLGMVD